MNRLNVLVAGSTGYIGVQLIKLLCKHKFIKIKYLCGNSSIGKQLYYYDKKLKKYNLPKIVKVDYKYFKEVDVIFTALPNGQSQIIANNLNKRNILIDLSADFRIKNVNIYKKFYKIKHKSKKLLNKSVYGLSELYEKQIKKSRIIACPGCYPTSILLPLIPLIKTKSINTKNIIIDSKSGYSGAGRGVHKKYKHKNLYESLSAYGVGFHRHNSEIDQELKNYTNLETNFTFTPHLTPMFRGILSTIYVDLKSEYSIDKVIRILKNFHKKNTFVKISKMNTLISTNDVINTNNCYISICKTKYKNKIIILSAIDNLIKGGAGQAIQNMNLKFGFNNNEGLK